MVFETKAVTLEQVISMIEGDLVGWLWYVAKCPCGHELGDYSAVVVSADYREGGAGLALGNRGLEVVAIEPQGHRIGSHGSSPADALGRAYGEALEKVK